MDDEEGNHSFTNKEDGELEEFIWTFQPIMELKHESITLIISITGIVMDDPDTDRVSNWVMFAYEWTNCCCQRVDW